MTSKLVGLSLLTAVATVLTLGGCGSDDNIGSTVGDSTDTVAAKCAGKNTLTGEGSTAQQNAIAVFNQAWANQCQGKDVAYNPTGSGSGREQFVAGHVDFAGSDSPLSDAQVAAAAQRCDGNPAWHLPLVLGPVGLVYHLDGVENLVLDGEVTARIFRGEITTWNDPALAALNPGVTLPGVAVTPIYRSDSSGTTDNFQRYLSVVAPKVWTNGAGSEFQGGVGEGAQKSAGVVQAVQATPGAISYVEKGFADQAGLVSARIDSGSGAVAPTDQAVGAAIQAVKLVVEGSHDMRLDVDSLYGASVAGAYPLVLVTYEIVCSRGYGPETAAAVKSFLTLAAGSGQAGLSAAGYVPLPDRFKQQLSSAIDAIE